MPTSTTDTPDSTSPTRLSRFYPKTGAAWPVLKIDDSFLSATFFAGQPTLQYKQYKFPNGETVFVVLHDRCLNPALPSPYVYRFSGLPDAIITEAALLIKLLYLAAWPNV